MAIILLIIGAVVGSAGGPIGVVIGAVFGYGIGKALSDKKCKTCLYYTGTVKGPMYCNHPDNKKKAVEDEDSCSKWKKKM